MGTDFRIGFIGVGAMGGGMTKRLLDSGYTVCVYDISTDNVNRAVKAGADKAETLSELAGKSNVFMVSLPNPQAVQAALAGEEGLLNYVPEGAVLIELSSIDPRTMRDVAEKMQTRGVDCLDVPVSGSPKEAEKGELVLIAGGREEIFSRMAPVLNTIGKSVMHVGDVGVAKTIKLVNNVMSMANVLVAAEAFTMGVKAGVDPDLLFQVLSNSGGRSHHFTKRFPNALQGNFEPGFTVELGEKDLRLALQMAHEVGSPLPVAALAQQLYVSLESTGRGKKDIVAILNLYEEWAGVSARGRGTS